MNKMPTYGQIEDTLLALGFKRYDAPTGHRYFKHPDSESLILLPAYARGEKLSMWHYVAIRGELDGFGFVPRDEFDAVIRNRGRVAS